MILDIIDISIEMEKMRREEPEWFSCLTIIFISIIVMLIIIMCTVYALVEDEDERKD